MVNLQSTALLFLLLLTSIDCYQADPLTSYLTDDSGRFVIFHGVNVVYKQFPYYPSTDSFNPMDSFAAQDLRNLNQWGFNAIRLYIAWQGFEPKQGQYNYTYLQKLRNITRQCKKYNISVLIDAHQDLYSRKFCGQGFPDWLVQKISFPAPLKIELKYDENGIPTKQSCTKISFPKYYTTDDVMRFSHDFFTNKNGMADKFTQMWLKVVGFFTGEDNVIGYDLINQPSGANAWKNPYDIIGPSVNNNKFLLPFYRNLSRQIRKVDQQKLIFFQPSVADYFGGFFQSPSGSQLSKKDVLSYHTYCPFKNAHNQPSSAKKCKIIDYLYMQQRMKNVKKLKCGSMMTEFGSMPDTPIAYEQIQRVLGQADKHWQSWFWWQYKYNNDSTSTTNPPWQQSLYYPNGTLQYNKIFHLSYPYAYAICGTPIEQTHTKDSYSLKIIPRTCGSLNTQIYINEKMYFPEGFTISFNPTCPKCILRNHRKNYYELIVPEENKNRKLELRVAGYI